MQNNKPDYYNDLEKVYTKIWELLDSGLKRRDAPFHIPTFICGDNKKFDGRIVVLRGINKEEAIELMVKGFVDEVVDKIETPKVVRMIKNKLMDKMKDIIE